MLRKGTAATFAAALAAMAGLGPAAPSAQGAETWRWPVTGEVITGYRNGDDPYAGGQHRGIDIAAGTGSPVVAAAAGTVRFAGLAGSSGLTVSIRTADGRLDTSYLHLAGVAVRVGDRVEGGKRIGAVGTSGRRSAPAPHLHFGVREAGSRHAYRDPLAFLPLAGPRSAPPRGAPVRIRAPGRVRPAPVPVRRPSPARRPVRARRRFRVPAGRRVRVPQGSRAPRVLPRPAPAPAPVPGNAPALAPYAVAPRAAPVPSAGPGPLPAAPPQPAAEPSPRHASPKPGGGLDVGWALACLGLLLAAACLGGPGRGDLARGVKRSARWSRLRALPGRR